MSKIIGITVGTPTSPKAIADKLKPITVDELPIAINAALAQAKASGEFDGKDGKDGVDGKTPIKGVDYFDGKDGSNGKDGVDGKTPAKGIDYFTETDKTEMVDAVIAALPKYNGEVIIV